MNGRPAWEPLGTPTSHREAAREVPIKEAKAGPRVAVSTQERQAAPGDRG